MEMLFLEPFLTFPNRWKRVKTISLVNRILRWNFNTLFIDEHWQFRAISSCHSPYVINVFARLISRRWNFNGFLRINFPMTNGIFSEYWTVLLNFSTQYFPDTYIFPFNKILNFKYRMSKRSKNASNFLFKIED